MSSNWRERENFLEAETPAQSPKEQAGVRAQGVTIAPHTEAGAHSPSWALPVGADAWTGAEGKDRDDKARDVDTG